MLERAAEALLLAGQPLLDRVALLGELGVRRTHELGHDVGVARQVAGLEAEHPALLDRAAHEPAQDVAALLVGGHDAVGDEEGHRPGVVGEDPQRPCRLAVGAVPPPGELLPQVDQRAELVGVEDRRHVLEDRRHAVEPHAGVDVPVGQGGERARGILVELHEHEVPELQEALGVVAGTVVGSAEGLAAVEVELRARTRRAGRPGLPEVVLVAERDDPVVGHADRAPGLDRLLVGTEAERCRRRGGR